MLTSIVKKMVLAAALCFSQLAFSADFSVSQAVAAELQSRTTVQAMLSGMDNWVVGDTCNYDIAMMGGMMKGTMVITVREKTAEGDFWIDQNVDMAAAGKQVISILLDHSTGQIKKMIVNGKEEAPPASSDVEVIETKEDKVTVPAGTFDSIYFKAKDKKSGQISEQWVNPKAIPIMGMLKQTAETQFGPMTTELTSFLKK